MPALPLIDALILAGSGGLVIGFVLKILWITTSYRPTFLGFSPMDILIMSGTCLALALTLAARTWVKSYEVRALRREPLTDAEAPFDFSRAAPPRAQASAPPSAPAQPTASLPQAGESKAAT